MHYSLNGWYSTDDLHVEGKLLKLKYRSEQHLLNFMYDQSRVPSNLKKTKAEGVKTRSGHKINLKIKKPLTERFKRSLAYTRPKKWNALPEHLQKATSKEVFKSLIARRISDKAAAAVLVREQGQSVRK